MPTTAYILDKGELEAILREAMGKPSLTIHHFDTDGVTVSWKGDSELTIPMSTGTATTAAAVESTCPCEDDDEDEHTERQSSVLDAIRFTPKTVLEIADDLDLDVYDVGCALNHLGDKVAKVAPAREDGETVSRWMATVEDAYEAFVAHETARVKAVTAKMAATVLAAMPPFYKEGRPRLEVFEKLADDFDDDQMEELLRDCKAICYALKAEGVLEHKDSTWRAAPTSDDKVKVAAIQGGIREVLRDKDEGMSTSEIRDALPETLDKALIRYAVRRMDDVYEDCGRKHLRD